MMQSIPGNTMLNACNRALTEGAKSVIACATHAVFAGDSLGLFARSNFSEVIVTDTMFVPGREYPFDVHGIVGVGAHCQGYLQHPQPLIGLRLVSAVTV